MGVAMKKAAMKSAAMKKAGAGAMKRVMKAKKVSKIAKGKHARASVFSGRKEKTLSGMTKDKLTKNKSGRIVSKKASARAKRARRSTPRPNRCWLEPGRAGLFLEGAEGSLLPWRDRAAWLMSLSRPLRRGSGPSTRR